MLREIDRTPDLPAKLIVSSVLILICRFAWTETVKDSGPDISCEVLPVWTKSQIFPFGRGQLSWHTRRALDAADLDVRLAVPAQ